MKVGVFFFNVVKCIPKTLGEAEISKIFNDQWIWI